MEEWANVEGEKLSGGARRLTAFCMAVVAPGKLVILDEPTNDVDPIRRRYLWQVIRKLTNDGTSVILVTHNVVEAEKAVDRVAILHKGRLLTQGTPSEVKSKVRNQMRLEMNLLKDFDEIDMPTWTISSNRKGARIIMTIDQEQVSSTINWVKDRVEKGFVMDYSLSPSTIEDVYIEITSGKVGMG